MTSASGYTPLARGFVVRAVCCTEGTLARTTSAIRPYIPRHGRRLLA
ncbi:hypothetical protein KO481_07925 [Nocardia sp. NEAU-G5]|uniref:Uncharacterized protein n=1 Tax=Nocardia albiluteola TaxID=2842303 RepID=A0ABS6ATT9_9NOCA|nr:hypothetical protein [Nocardia albiluteola]MBU3061449.1 hypothetical protein [Nocardia albiluteola]